MNLTLEEKLSFAEARAREEVAEKHFFDLNKDWQPLGFSIGYRNPGHWDVYADQRPGKVQAWNTVNTQGWTSARDGGRERAFYIRGIPGEVIVRDERWDPYRPFPRDSLTFTSVSQAMVYIESKLMGEPV